MDAPDASQDTDDRRSAAVRQARIARADGRMRAFRLAYDGTPFRGFQRQPDVATVEDALFDALRTLDVFETDGGDDTHPDRPPGYAAAGRTDAGVSALAQTIAFACPEWLTPRALNAELPASIRAWASADVDRDFHATHDAVRREYTYYLHAPRERGPDREAGQAVAGRQQDGHVSVDDERVRAALSTLSGRHDFHNLTPDDDGTVRDLTASVERDGEFLVVRAAADGFPRQFVRRLVTLLRRVGCGDADHSLVERTLEADPLSGAAGIGPAPPEPLVLADVRYHGCAFERDPEAAASTATAFAERRSTALANARVAESVWEGVSTGQDDGASDNNVSTQ